MFVMFGDKIINKSMVTYIDYYEQDKKTSVIRIYLTNKETVFMKVAREQLEKSFQELLDKLNQA